MTKQIKLPKPKQCTICKRYETLTVHGDGLVFTDFAKNAPCCMDCLPTWFEPKNKMVRTHYTYFGVLIVRNTEPGYRLRYTARAYSGSTCDQSFAANTLAEIKALIREHFKTEEKRLIKLRGYK